MTLCSGMNARGSAILTVLLSRNGDDHKAVIASNEGQPLVTKFPKEKMADDLHAVARLIGSPDPTRVAIVPSVSSSSTVPDARRGRPRAARCSRRIAREMSEAQLRAEAEAGTLVLPGGISISRSLIEAWYGGPLPGSW